MQLTFLLWVIWFGAAFCYYGVVLLTTELLNILKEQQEKSNLSSNVMQCIGESTNLSAVYVCLPINCQYWVQFICLFCSGREALEERQNS